MATRLILKSESHYRDQIETSTNINTTTVEEYVEGESDTLHWRFEVFIRLLRADGYTEDMIQRYLNYDGCEVFEIEESYSKYEKN